MINMHRIMIYLDLYTIKSCCLTCKNINTNYDFWKRKYFLDKLPLFCIKTTLMDWVNDYKKITNIKSLTYQLIKQSVNQIHIRYNYQKLRYNYDKYGYDIHYLLIKLLPLPIQQQIINGNGDRWQELVIYYKKNSYRIIYHENYVIDHGNISYELASIYKLFIYMLYYCPKVDIYLYKNKLI